MRNIPPIWSGIIAGVLYAVVASVFLHGPIASHTLSIAFVAVGTFLLERFHQRRRMDKRDEQATDG
jgi:hypothetical protein